jgi:F-type H+-transporting ATPase subunit gamma
MTRLHNVQSHRHSLGEIRDIMNSMKTLAYMETRKLTRFLDAQHAVVQSIEDVAVDLLGFNPEILPETKQAAPVYILIGSERGFCGDFNRSLLKAMESVLPTHSSKQPMLIAVGRKLHTLMKGDARIVASIDGASVVEEVTTLLIKLVNELTALQHKHGALAVYCIYQDGGDGELIHELLPPFKSLLQNHQRYSNPPVLNLSPQAFFVELTDHYLFAALHEMLYKSLMMENQYRVSHLDGAVKHLDEESAELERECNALRQEEIIEEIEEIMLSAASFKDGLYDHK